MKYKLKRREKKFRHLHLTENTITVKGRRKDFSAVNYMLWYKQMLEQGSWLNVSE